MVSSIFGAILTIVILFMFPVVFDLLMESYLKRPHYVNNITPVYQEQGSDIQ